MRKWKSKDGQIKLYHADCLKLLPKLNLDKRKTAIVSDPPYGIDYQPGTQRNSQQFDKVRNDEVLFDPTPFSPYYDCLLWGCNNFHNNILGGQWYFWDKICRNGLKVKNSEAEYAWHKKGTKPRGFRLMWCGAYRDIGSGERGKKNVHATQKPISLMCWCLQRVKPNLLVVDPYMGSGTTMLACIREKRRGIGIEIDEGYFEIAIERVKKELQNSKRRLV